LRPHAGSPTASLERQLEQTTNRLSNLLVRDSELVYALLGLNSLDAVLSNPVAGSNWEGFVVEQLINAAPPPKPAFTGPAMKPS